MADPTQDMINALSPADQAAMSPETFANPLVKKKIDDFAKVLAIPGNVYNSPTPTTGEDLIPQAVQMAAQFGVTGMPMAKPGTAGIFGGKLAKTADLKALNEAQQMAANGMHPEDVLQSTGWFRSPADYKWRFEIPDTKSALKYMPTEEGSRAVGSTSSLFHHPDLYKAYPELQNFKFDLTRQGITEPNYQGSGLWSGPEKTAYVQAPNMALGRSVGLHELQHAVQDIEGFSPGNNPSYYAHQIEQKLRNSPEGFKNYNFADIEDKAHALYHQTAGEVEARNTQARRGMQPSQRLLNPPWATQDVPYIDQYHYDPLMETLTALRDKR